MPRHPRLFLFGAVYHAHCRVARGEFARRMESLSGHSLAELSSRFRGADLTRGRLEFATLAVGRYRLKVSDIAALLDKHPNSVTNWLNNGLRLERQDPGFKERLDHLDASISRQS